MKHSKIRIGHIGVLLLIVIGLCSLVLFVGVPSYLLASESKAIAHALEGSRSVTITEFVPYFDMSGETIVQREHVLRTMSATPEQISEFRAATGGILTVNTSLAAHSRCFMPHHRLEAIQADGTTFRVEVCFLCSNFRIDGSGIDTIPSRWLNRLERFFTTAGMPPRTRDEYDRLTPGRR